jgi:hypothetical protein
MQLLVSKKMSVAPDDYPNDQAEWLAFSVADISTSPNSDEGNGSKNRTHLSCLGYGQDVSRWDRLTVGECVADIGMKSLESASLIPKIDYHSQLLSYIHQ